MPETHIPPSARQMSDAMITVVFLTLSGGFQDAYTYLMRGQVFANAQTGNIVLMSARLFQGDFAGAARYLLPLFAFALGVLLTEGVRAGLRRHRRLHWRQAIVLAEIALLFLAGLLPRGMDSLANALVSLACAMQVQAFRKVQGSPYASTMCIGNLRSAMESLHGYLLGGNRAALRTAGQYALLLCLFAVGAGLGGLMSPVLGMRAIWLCCGLLLICFVLMFGRGQAC